MSNVEYRCPKCGLRLFAAPGGTHIHCPNDTDTLYEQVEEYGGPNFAFVEEGEKDPTKTGLVTAGVQPGTVNRVTREPDPKTMSEDEIKVFYRERYREISGERPDMRWGTSRLKEEIEAWERGAEEEEAARQGKIFGEEQPEESGDGGHEDEVSEHLPNDEEETEEVDDDEVNVDV